MTSAPLSTAQMMPVATSSSVAAPDGLVTLTAMSFTGQLNAGHTHGVVGHSADDSGHPRSVAPVVVNVVAAVQDVPAGHDATGEIGV